MSAGATYKAGAPAGAVGSGGTVGGKLFGADDALGAVALDGPAAVGPAAEDAARLGAGAGALLDASPGIAVLPTRVLACVAATGVGPDADWAPPQPLAEPTAVNPLMMRPTPSSLVVRAHAHLPVFTARAVAPRKRALNSRRKR